MIKGQPTFVTLFASAVLRHAVDFVVVKREEKIAVITHRMEDGELVSIREELDCKDFALLLHNASMCVTQAAAMGWSVKLREHSIYAEEQKGVTGRIFERRDSERRAAVNA